MVSNYSRIKFMKLTAHMGNSSYAAFLTEWMRPPEDSTGMSAVWIPGRSNFSPRTIAVDLGNYQLYLPNSRPYLIIFKLNDLIWSILMVSISIMNWTEFCLVHVQNKSSPYDHIPLKWKAIVNPINWVQRGDRIYMNAELNVAASGG